MYVSTREDRGLSLCPAATGIAHCTAQTLELETASSEFSLSLNTNSSYLGANYDTPPPFGKGPVV